MATVTSNAKQVIAGLAKLASEIDLRKPGIAGERTAGLDVRAIMVLGMEARFNRGEDVSSGAFAPNNAKYKARKGGRAVGYGPDRLGHTGGLMRSQVEMLGTVVITQSSVTAVYGASEEGKREAQWFSNGTDGAGDGAGEHSGAKNQPPRPFWGLDEKIHAEADTYAQEWIQSILVHP